jgi:excisionase family DNA binding protein
MTDNIQIQESKIVEKQEIEEKKELFYKTADIARKLRVSHSTVLKWIREKKLNAKKIITGQYRISDKEFKLFLETPFIEGIKKKTEIKTEEKTKEKTKEKDEDWLF